VNVRACTIAYYDSLRGSGKDVIEQLARYFAREHEVKKNAPLPKAFTAGRAPSDLCQQRNGVDCGVFVCAMMTCLMYGIEPLEDVVSQRDIPLWRRKVAAACVDAARAGFVDASL